MIAPLQRLALGGSHQTHRRTISYVQMSVPRLSRDLVTEGTTIIESALPPPPKGGVEDAHAKVDHRNFDFG